jgi:hypothetical protein
LSSAAATPSSRSETGKSLNSIGLSATCDESAMLRSTSLSAGCSVRTHFVDELPAANGGIV